MLKKNTKKEWKIVYVNSEDIDILWWKKTNTHKIIIPEEKNIEEEIKTGFSILKAMGKLENGGKIISCPTCGRTHGTLFKYYNKLEKWFNNQKWHKQYNCQYTKLNSNLYCYFNTFIYFLIHKYNLYKNMVYYIKIS